MEKIIYRKLNAHRVRSFFDALRSRDGRMVISIDLDESVAAMWGGLRVARNPSLRPGTMQIYDMTGRLVAEYADVTVERTSGAPLSKSGLST